MYLKAAYAAVYYGAGVVPKEQMVTLPLHPHCHCRYQPFYDTPKKKRDKKSTNPHNG